MTSRAKRLTVLLMAAALAAVIAGSVMAPNPAAAARKLKDPNAFVITATLEHQPWSKVGSFKAVGAIEDSGDAVAPYGGSQLILYGQNGLINMRLNDPVAWEFTITEGTGAYVGLTGSGTYSYDVHGGNGKGGKPRDTRARGGMERAAGGNGTSAYKLEGTVGQ